MTPPGQKQTREAQLAALPAQPGVYMFRDEAGEILYVGKARSLRPRVRSYFRSRAGEGLKASELRRRTADIETFVVESDADALLLESSLIKEYLPRFNIQLRDDKSYPYIKVTVGEDFPRVLVTRRLRQDGARYFGPYTDVGSMRRALRLLKRTFKVRSCHYDLPATAPERPCLDYHIHRCKAPCVGWQSREDYRRMTEEVLQVLSGHTGALRKSVRERMESAAQRLEFETAAELRDVLRGLDVLSRRQLTVDFKGGDRDVVGVMRRGNMAAAVLLRVREGRLLGRLEHHLSVPAEETDDALVAAATKALTLQLEELPPEILVPSDFADRPVMQELLAARRGHKLEIRVPLRGRKRELVALANSNAERALEQAAALGTLTASGGSAPGTEAAAAPQAAVLLAEALNLPDPPRDLVCFDISTLGGTDSVGSLVWLSDGRTRKERYRRFRIREANRGTPDDYAMMQEVVRRYFLRLVREDRPMPDLVVVDGGKGQLSAALQAMESAGVSDIRAVALAKREEELFLPGRPDSVRLPRTHEGLKWLQRARDEAHRFAVSYNRQLRRERTLRSRLSDIPGVGRSREKELLRRFGSVRAIKKLTAAQIAEVPGIGPATAQRISESLSSAAGV
ncbi:MAG: excinuclease ABC subunit UvrC [Gemmatimonadota bacterium]